MTALIRNIVGSMVLFIGLAMILHPYLEGIQIIGVGVAVVGLAAMIHNY